MIGTPVLVYVEMGVVAVEDLELEEEVVVVKAADEVLSLD